MKVPNNRTVAIELKKWNWIKSFNKKNMRSEHPSITGLFLFICKSLGAKKSSNQKLDDFFVTNFMILIQLISMLVFSW